MPVDYLPTMQPTEDADGATPAAIREMRERAKLLLQQRSKVPVYTWANGLDDASAKIFGGLETRRANELEQQGLQSGARDLSRVIPGYGLLGNNPPSAAPGGAAPTAPFQPQAGSPSGQGASYTGDLLKFVQDQEGFEPKARWDNKQYSVGYGSKANSADEVVDQPAAKRRLYDELGRSASFVESFAPDAPVSVKHALTDLSYNTGTGWAQSGLGKAVKDQDWPTARKLFLQYNKEGGEFSQNLYNRRLAMAPLIDGSGEGTAPQTAQTGQYPKLFQDLSKLSAYSPTNDQPAPQGAQAQPPVRTAQNAPAGTTGAPGMPQPLTSPMLQMNQQDLQRILANPYIPTAQKQYIMQQMISRSEVQRMPVEGGTLEFDAQGRRNFIPAEPKHGEFDVGGMKVPTINRYNPKTGQWELSIQTPTQQGAPAPQGVAPAPAGVAPAPAPGAPVAGSAAPGSPAKQPVGPTQAIEQVQPDDLKPPTMPTTGNLNDWVEYGGRKKAFDEALKASSIKQADKDTEYYSLLHNGTTGLAGISSQQRQNLFRLYKLANDPNLAVGAGSDAALFIKRWAATLGIEKKGASPTEQLNLLAARVLGDQFTSLNSMAASLGEKGSRIFKPMLDVEEAANITPKDSVEGLKAKIKTYLQAGDFFMKWGDLADDYKKKNGKLDAGFDKALRHQIAKARIDPDSVAVDRDQVHYKVGDKWYDNPFGE